jgi:hypothetical protein
MADGEGALVAQQRFAAEEPYKNIEATQNSIKMGLNAFQIGASINSKRQQLENQLAMMALRQQHMENQDAIREAQFGLATTRMQMGHEMDVARLQNTIDHQARMYDLAQTQEERRGATVDYKIQKDQDRNNAQANLLNLRSQLAEEGITPGHPDYYSRYSAAIAAAAQTGSFSPSETVALSKAPATEQNTAINSLHRASKAEYDALAHDASNTIFGASGASGSFDPRPILHPEQFPDEYKPQKFDWSTFSYGPKEPTGYKLIPTMTAQGKPGPPRRVAVEDLVNLNKRYQDWQANNAKIPPLVNVPDAGVFGRPAITREQLAQRALVDPDATEQEKARAREILQYRGF